MRILPVNISTLTPVRGFAAILVAIYHFNYAFIIAPPEGYPFISKSYLMVDLFFIMSGFIMMHVYHHIFSNNINLVSFKKFILARFARIYPLHLFILILYVALIYLGGHGSKNNPIYQPSAIITNIFLLQACGLHPTGTWNVASWSISAEWWAYMIFPFVCFSLFKKKTIAIIIVSITILLIYLLIIYYLPRNGYLVDTGDIDVSYSYGYLRGIAGFLGGMILYLLYENSKIKIFFKNDAPVIITLLIIIFAMQTNLFDLYCIPLFMVLVLSLACNEKKVCKISNFKFLQFLGDISYSFYLTHGLIILLIIQALKFTKIGYNGPAIIGIVRGAPYIIAFIIIVLGVSYFTYNYIEKPARNWINHKFNKNKTASVKAA